jgi:hypothetical protein
VIAEYQLAEGLGGRCWLSVRPCPRACRRSPPSGANRIETTVQEITDQMELARHGAHTFRGLLTRTAAAIAAHTLIRACLAGL